MSERVASIDLDGVIIERHPIQLRALVRFLIRSGVIYKSPGQIPVVDRQVNNGPLSSLELVVYLIHKGRKVVIGARECLLATISDCDIVGNTGRPNKKAWIELTQKTLEAGGVLDCFQNIYFTPRGVKALLSKGAALVELQRQYEHITHLDDNPADVLPLAKLFPDVQFVIVQDLTTGVLFSKVEQEQYPNVRRVATLREGILS